MFHANLELGNILRSLFFPLLFQNDFLHFAWGAYDPFWVMLMKRTLLLLPVLAILLGLWSTILCFLSVIIREQRREFVTTIFITWWDLGRSILTFWGGIFKFFFTLIGSGFGMLRFLVVGFWAILQDFFMAPFRMVQNAAGNLLKPGIPWIAVSLTLIWCILEAVIFYLCHNSFGY